MNESQKDGDLTPLLSSYGLVTAERILAKYGIKLTPEEILAVVKARDCLYHHLLRIPYKNILNGIVIQQAHDYYVYAQKLFVDYLLSGETGKSEDMPGSSTRELLEEERQRLLGMGDAFQDLKNDNYKLIADSQARIINFAASLRIASTQSIKAVLELLHAEGITIITIDKALHHALVYTDLSQKDSLGSLFMHALGLSLDNAQGQSIMIALTNLNTLIQSLDANLKDFIDASESITAQTHHFRKEFRGLVLRAKELISLLPEYKHDDTQENKHKEALNFDSSIG